jgi:hypothetical protein
MKVFDVSINGRKICRAGVGADGVLTAIVGWSKLTGMAAAEARRLGQPPDETRLHVGGLRNDTHFSWSDRNLQPGDRVTIEVTQARTSDPPAGRKRNDPAQQQRREKEYYLRLKQKFDGQPQAGDETTLLNVDLDIWSRSPLDSLVAAFGRRVIVLHVGKEGRRHVAHLELARDDRARGADRRIRDFVTLIRRLPAKVRASWNRAQRRDFNIGIQAAGKPFSHAAPLHSSTVRAVAAVNARIVVTVYGAEKTW